MFKSGYVAMIGRPNTGKSTLLNRVLGTEISIVTSKAQTTRDQIQGILTQSTGQMIFVDTPGIHRAREGGLNEYMVNQAREALASPNVIWYLIDPQSALEHESIVLELLKQSGSSNHQAGDPPLPLMVLFNKIDRFTVSESFEKNLLEQLKLVEGIQVVGVEHISAQTGESVPDLLDSTWELLPEGPKYFPDDTQASDRPMKYFVAEKIREQLLRCLGDEVPYSCAVEINRFQESTKPIRIEATIHVERESQKGMVVGNGGKKIKEIGQSARKEIEKLLGEQIFLGLQVVLSKNWTQNKKELKKIGYAV